MRVLLYFFVFVVVSLFANVSFAGVSSVVVKGNERIDTQTVLFYADVDLDSEWDSKALASLIKRLYATNLFSDVKIDVTKNDTMVISITENPVLISLKFKGNRVFDDKVLSEVFPELKEMRVFSKAKIQSDIAKLTDMYNKAAKWGVRINYEIEKLLGNRIACTINIDEGPTAKIRRIVITGNKVFSEADLRSVLHSRETTILGFLSSAGNYSSENLIADRVMLKRFYASNGYIDFDVVSEVAEISDDYTSVSLFLSLHEGQRYSFGTTKFQFDKEILSASVKEQLTRILSFNKGDVFNSSMLSFAIEMASKVLNDQGYPFAFIDYDQVENGKFVDTTYKVVVGSKVYVDSVTVKGNLNTMEYVIKRKLTIRSGDPYSAIKVEQSKKAIYALGFFDNVDVQTRRVSEGLVALEFIVQEHSTGVFQVGGGYSSASGFMANVNITQKNFLGTGQEVSLALEKSQRRFSSSFSIGQHDIFGSDVTFLGGLFYLSDHPSDLSFEREEKGVSAAFARGLADNLSGSLSYSYKKSDIKSSMPNPSIFIREQEGISLDSSVGYRLSYGDVDNNIHPVDGYMFSLSQDLSGLGGNVNYIRTGFTAGYYKPILTSITDGIFFKAKSRLGYIFDYTGDQLKIGQRFFLGGEEVRGFENYGIGPRTYIGEPLGGKFVLSGLMQVDFPLGFAKDIGIAGSLFADFGTLFGLDYKDPDFYRRVYNDKSLRVSVGFGFSWQSPMGPMRIDFGFPLNKEPYDVENMIRFSMDY